MSTKKIIEKKNNEFAKGEIILDHYKIERIIGRGGMNSIIYLANDMNVVSNSYFDLKVKGVAIKVIKKTSDISEEDWKRFWNETVTMYRLKSAKSIRYLAEIFDRIMIDDTIYIIMEYVEGETLAKMIAKNEKLTVKESLYILKKILLVLQDLHHSYQEIIIHRDLKPGNIMISKDRTEVKIIDFGISTSIKTLANKNKQLLTFEDEIWASYPYLTPQILELRGKTNEQRKEIISKIGVQFDIYATGVIFYEMLMGKKPFVADDYDKVDILYLPLKYDIPVISKINTNIYPIIENVILRMLASKNTPVFGEKNKNSVEMYESVNDIVKDIDEIEEYLNEKNTTMLNQQLLKLPEIRVLQTPRFFNVINERNRFYEETWFFILFISIFSLLIATIVILFLVL
ncbi:MAG: serine/threonine protein kinase [Mycoplasmataceae bacterium]|nr:serine/threonine protein kinase [Mycoplasmataceae bacterium]